MIDQMKGKFCRLIIIMYNWNIITSPYLLQKNNFRVLVVKVETVRNKTEFIHLDSIGHKPAALPLAYPGQNLSSFVRRLARNLEIHPNAVENVS